MLNKKTVFNFHVSSHEVRCISFMYASYGSEKKKRAQNELLRGDCMRKGVTYFILVMIQSLAGS